MALAALHEVGEERPVPVDHAPQVDLEHPPPLVLEHPLAARCRPAGDAGVVAQHVHAPERVDGGVAEPIDGVAVGDVGRHTDRLRAGCGDRRDRIVELGFLDVGEDDVHAGASEPLGERPAHARACPGDHCRLPCEVLHTAKVVRGPQR